MEKPSKWSSPASDRIFLFLGAPLLASASLLLTPKDAFYVGLTLKRKQAKKKLVNKRGKGVF
jgi:hypothetical protein